jgi:hypothetical protein
MDPIRAERFTGINNRTPIDRLPVGEAGRAVRDAVNVDLTRASTFQHRPGFSRILELPNCRDMHQTAADAMVASDDKLYTFDGSAVTEVAALASPFVSVAYADSPLGVIWSDGFSLNVFKGQSRRLIPATPNPAPIATAAVGGSLVSGTYGVRFAALNPDGQQSAPTNPVFVTVPANGFIQVSTLAQALPVIVFVTAVDGAVFYRETTIPAGQTSITIPFVRSAGQSMTSEIIASLPPGRMLAMHKGRLLSATGQYLFYSLPWALGLYRPAQDYIWLDQDITLIEPVEGGTYIATQTATYFLAGEDISKASMPKVASYGAVRGTVARDPDSLDPMWHTPSGPVQANQSGGLTLLQSNAIAYPDAASGTSIVRESNGMSQFITTLTQAKPSGSAVFGSYMEARVITGAAS